MLGDEVTRTGVQRSRQKRTQDQIAQRPTSHPTHQGIVERQLRHDVERMDPRQGQPIHEHGPQRIEQDLKGTEKRLARHAIEKDGLERGGQVGVQPVDAEALVVGQVVGPEGGRVRDADGEIGDDGEEPVEQCGAEGEVVADFVDGEEEVLVGGGADQVRGREEGEREHGGVAEEVGAEDLEEDDGEDEVFGQGLWPAELGDLVVVVSNGHRREELGVTTSGWALIIACLLVRWGSSVYVQKKRSWSSSFWEVTGAVFDSGFGGLAPRN